MKPIPSRSLRELETAYECVIEAEVIHFWESPVRPPLFPEQARWAYLRAHQSFQTENFKAAEHWARLAQALSEALQHEARISYMEPRIQGYPEPPSLAARSPVIEVSHAQRLVDTASKRVTPENFVEVFPQAQHCLERARFHLSKLETRNYRNPWLRKEGMSALRAYAQALEILEVALEEDRVGLRTKSGSGSNDKQSRSA